VVDVRYDAEIPDELGIHGSFCVECGRVERDCLRARPPRPSNCRVCHRFTSPATAKS
jgi:hypothetical protein